MTTEDTMAASAAPASAPAPTAAPAPTTGAAQPQRRKTTKSKKPPVKDTVTVLIPLHVTADLGVAMRRSRTKRTRKLHELYPELAPDSNGGGGRKGYGKDAKQAEVEGDDSGDDEEDEEVAEKSGGGKKGKQAKGAGEGDDSSRGDLSPAPSASGGDRGPGVMRREDYGSVLDYLEAKYVRGVQIGGMEVLDEDDGASSGEGKNKKGRGGPKYAAEADDYSGEGLVYSDECSDDGFLDDSMLRHEVVEQVMATGKYGGRTKVEDEARKERRGSSLYGALPRHFVLLALVCLCAILYAYELRDSNFGDPVFLVFGLSDTAVCAHLEKHAAKQANQNTSVNNRPPSNYHK